MPAMLNLLRHILIPAAAAFLILALGILAVAGGSFAQTAAGVRMAGPVILGYAPSPSAPFLDITQSGMTNLPDWVVNNPMRDDATSSHKIPAGAVDLSGLPSGGGQTGGLAAVASDSTITGDGTHDDPLSVASPFTLADNTKLTGIEDRATRDQTPAEIVAGLSGLSGASRLPASAVQGLPAGGGNGGLTAVTSDASLSGSGTDTDPLRVTEAITATQKADLAQLAQLAIAGNVNKFVSFDASGNLVVRNGTAAGSAVTIRETGTLTALNAVSSPVAGEIGVVYGDTPANNGVYYRTNTQWERIADLTPAIIPASRLPQASGSASGIINAAEYAKINSAIDGADLHNTPALFNSSLQSEDAVLLDDASVTSGSELKEISIAELDKRWGDDNTGPIPLTRLPEDTQIVSRAVQSGGNRPWPDDNIQFCGPIRANAYVAGDVAAISRDEQNRCGASATRVDGVRIAPAYFVMRFNAAAYPNQPDLTDVPNLRAGYNDPEGGEAPVVPNDLTALGSATSGATWWYFATGVNDLPAGQTGVRVEIDEPTTLDLDLAPNTVVPADLKFAAGDRVDGRAITILNNGEFGSQFINDTRQLFNGPLTGISVTSATADSATGRNNLTESLNLNSEPHGIIAGAWTPSLVSRSSESILFHNGQDSITVQFTSTIEAIAREPIYNGSNQLGYILATTDIILGATQLGDAVLYAARHDDGSVSLVEKYEAQAASTARTYTWSIPSRLELVVIGSGAPRGLGGGSWFAYSALPDADAFADGDLVLVYGQTNKGAWRKTSTEVPGTADTGLSNLTLDPRTDLISNASGSTEFVYFARAALNSELPAGGTWATAPAALSSIRLGYDRNSLDNGFLVIVFSSARNYTGSIVIRSGIYAIHMDRQRISGSPSTTTWRIDGLTAGEVRTLRQMDWAFSEPDGAGFDTVHKLTRVLAGDGPEYLLEYTPSSSGGFVGLQANRFVTLNSQPAWTRALTAGDDNRMLCAQVILSLQSTIDRPAWSSPMCVKAGEWRTADNQPDSAAISASGIYAFGTTVKADHSSGVLSPLVIGITKGAGGKLSVNAPSGAYNLHHARIWLD